MIIHERLSPFECITHIYTEQFRSQLEPGRFQARTEERADTRGLDLPDGFSLRRDARLFITKNVSQDDGIPFHPGNFGNRYDFTLAALQACLLNNQIDGRRDLLANDFER